MKKIYLFIFVMIFFNLKTSLKSEVSILFKINNEIITNMDIIKEAKYLMALNNQLKTLNDKKINEIARESLIREKIKRIELSKFFLLDQKNPYLDTVIENFYLKLNIESKEQFGEYLKDYNLTIQEIKKKIEIENLWNQLIYDKYKSQVYIDEEKLKRKIISEKKLQSEIIYKLSEIVFEKQKDKTLDDAIKIINKSISEIGFENSANTFSLSDSSKFGGNIGWIKKKDLSDIIYKNIADLKIGSHTVPIQLGGNFLILKLEDIKNEKVEIDQDAELKRMVNFEQTRQLNKFSTIYYNKVKINIDVKKL